MLLSSNWSLFFGYGSNNVIKIFRSKCFRNIGASWIEAITFNRKFISAESNNIKYYHALSLRSNVRHKEDAIY
jgi:hypothetical protein